MKLIDVTTKIVLTLNVGDVDLEMCYSKPKKNRKILLEFITRKKRQSKE